MQLDFPAFPSFSMVEHFLFSNLNLIPLKPCGMNRSVMTIKPFNVLGLINRIRFAHKIRFDLLLIIEVCVSVPECFFVRFQISG